MWQKGLYMLAGVVIGPAVGPIVKSVARPVTREAIKFGILASDKIHEIAQEVREDLEDLTAEARAEIEKTAEAEKHHASRPRRAHHKKEAS